MKLFLILLTLIKVELQELIMHLQLKQKTIWKQDTTKMVIKTAVWELYNMLKPFINLPIELKADWANTNEKNGSGLILKLLKKK